MNDQELTEKIIAGDSEAFELFYNTYFRRIYNYIFAKVRNHADTEDLTQEVFLAAVHSLRNFEGRSSLLCWMYAVTRNTLRNWMRKKQKESRFCRIDTEFLEYYRKENHTPLTHVTFSELLQEWHKVLDKGPGISRKIFEMKHFEGMSIKEISRKTGKSEGSIKSHLYRTRKSLLQTLP